MFQDHAHEVLPRIWVGDQASLDIALGAGDFAILNVLESGARQEEMWIPILLKPSAYEKNYQHTTAYRVRLEEAADWVHRSAILMRRKTLVHCGGGAERSPLTVVWFMNKYMGMTVDEAYRWLMRMRPQVMDRRTWIEA